MTPEEANKQVTESLKTKMNMLLACGYSNHWWFALVCEVNNDYKKFYSNFQPHGFTPKILLALQVYSFLGLFGGILHTEKKKIKKL